MAFSVLKIWLLFLFLQILIPLNFSFSLVKSLLVLVTENNTGHMTYLDGPHSSLGLHTAQPEDQLLILRITIPSKSGNFTGTSSK